jgi:hypothetical protein
MKLHKIHETWVSVSVTTVSFGVNSDHIGDVRAFNVSPVEHLLAKIVEFVREDASLDPERIVGGLAN